MSYTSIENQPIIFKPESQLNEDCCGNGDVYKQLLDYNDQVYFELKTSQCALLNAAVKYGSGWGLEEFEGQVCSTDPTEDGAYNILYNIPNAFDLYQVTFTIDTMTEGTLYIYMQYCPLESVTLPGTYTFYFSNPDIFFGNSVLLTFLTDSGNGWVGCINTSSIKVYGVPSNTQLNVGIVDAVTLETVALLTPNTFIEKDIINVAFNVIDIPVTEGCYRFAISDFCENTCGQSRILNGLFMADREGIAHWTSAGGFGGFVALTQGNAYFDLSYEEAEAALINDTIFCVGKTYSVTVVISELSNVSLYAGMGSTLVPVATTAGTFTFEITCGSPSTYGTQFYLFAQLSGFSAGYANITSVEIHAVESSITWDLYSDIVAIGDFSDECKYFRIEGCNGEDQFNFSFQGKAFIPGIRLEGRKFHPQYESDVDAFRYASGRWTASYVDIKKRWRFNFGRLPEYVYDFLSIVFYFDRCFVNGTLYFPATDQFPTITWNDADNLGELNIELVRANYKLVKTRCLGEGANCVPHPVTPPSGERLLLTQSGSSLLDQSGQSLYEEF